MINILKTDNKIYRYPLTIIVLPAVILSFFTMLSWHVFYAPSIEKNEQQSYILKKQLNEVDQLLKKQNQQLKRTQVASMNIEAAGIYETLNNSTIKLLGDISKLTKLSENHFSIKNNTDKSITITLKPVQTSKLYTLVESIESKQYIDRIKIIINNEEHVITIYVRHLRDIKL